MTKFILHGGFAQNITTSNGRFYDAMAEHLPENGKYLGVYWAREKETWQKHFDADCERLQRTGKISEGVTFDMAVPDKFVEQIKNADVVYFRGGTPIMLQQAVKALDVNMKNLLKGKSLVAGDSSGAIMLAHGGYSFSGDQFVEGQGILNYKVLVHSDNPNYIQGLSKIKAAGDMDMPILYLPECEFVMMECEIK